MVQGSRCTESNGQGHQEAAIINENWDKEKLNRILKEAHRRFYLSLWYIWERFREVRSLKELLDKARAGLKVMKWYMSRGTVKSVKCQFWCQFFC